MSYGVHRLLMSTSSSLDVAATVSFDVFYHPTVCDAGQWRPVAVEADDGSRR